MNHRNICGQDWSQIMNRSKTFEAGVFGVLLALGLPLAIIVAALIAG